MAKKKPVTLYTIGYEKRDIEEYVNILLENGITTLVDVREKAWSYKRDFRKPRFADAMTVSGIKYVHIREAGNPRLFRQTSWTPKESLERYREYLYKTKAGMPQLEEIISNGKKEKICLTCFEGNPQQCHRQIICEYLATVFPSLEVKHL